MSVDQNNEANIKAIKDDITMEKIENENSNNDSNTCNISETDIVLSGDYVQINDDMPVVCRMLNLEHLTQALNDTTITNTNNTNDSIPQSIEIPISATTPSNNKPNEITEPVESVISGFSSEQTRQIEPKKKGTKKKDDGYVLIGPKDFLPTYYEVEPSKVENKEPTVLQSAYQYAYSTVMPKYYELYYRYYYPWINKQ